MNENNLLAIHLLMHISWTLDVQYELESIRVTFRRFSNRWKSHSSMGDTMWF